MLAQPGLFLLLTILPVSSEQAELHKDFGGDTTRTADSKRYFILVSLLENMASCSVYKGGRRRKGRECSDGVFLLQ